MRISAKGIELIKHFESFSAVPYICPAGYNTIGYGHVIRPYEDFSRPLTKGDAEQLLQYDIRQFETAVSGLITAPLNQNQFDSLTSFTFNLGSGALQRSTLRQKLNRGEYDEAAPEFLKWVYAGGRKLKGLILRRKAEMELYNL